MLKSKNLTVRQKKAVSLLASGVNYRQTCIALKLNRRTLWRWRQNEYFLRALEEEKNKYFKDFKGDIDELKKKAIRKLSAYLDDDSVDISTKIYVCFNTLSERKINVNYVGYDPLKDS